MVKIVTKQLTNRHRLGVITLVFIIGLLPIYQVLAEEIRGVEGPWSMYTFGYTQYISGSSGPYYYRSRAGTVSDVSAELSIETRGFNNGGGWHQLDRNSCTTSGTTCYPPDLIFDTSESPDSTDRYATSGHNVTYAGSLYTYYTSSDGQRSRYACLVTPGC